MTTYPNLDNDDSGFRVIFTLAPSVRRRPSFLWQRFKADDSDRSVEHTAGPKVSSKISFLLRYIKLTRVHSALSIHGRVYMHSNLRFLKFSVLFTDCTTKVCIMRAAMIPWKAMSERLEGKEGMLQITLSVVVDLFLQVQYLDGRQLVKYWSYTARRKLCDVESRHP